MDHLPMNGGGFRPRRRPSRSDLEAAFDEVLRRLPADVASLYRLGAELPPRKVVRSRTGTVYTLRFYGDSGVRVWITDLVKNIGAGAEGARELARHLGATYKRERKRKRKRKGRRR